MSGNVFRGNNTLQLNEGTIIEALQYYFDNRVFNKDMTAPKVGSVKMATSGMGYTSQNIFEVQIETKEENESGKPV